MSDYQDSAEAVNAIVVAIVEAQGLEDDTQWENTEFNPQNRPVWASVSTFSNTPQPVTMGRGGEDREYGYARIVYHVGTNTGTRKTNELVTQARQTFPAGKSVTVNGVTVTVTSIGASAGSTVDSWFVRPLTINYRTELTRANF